MLLEHHAKDDEEVVVASFSRIGTDNHEIRVIRRRLESWENSWKQQNLEVLENLYDQEYMRSDGIGKTELIERLEWVFDKNDRINMRVENARFRVKDNQAVSTFTQWYESDRHTDSGTKTLIWKKKQGKWRILREAWDHLE
ncbi:MAG: nuclear transport factor 2 family protein [Magnetococcales bacterium]|nr:nuclear transport factor 2 family protein [Magnetococcales bacterium]